MYGKSGQHVVRRSGDSLARGFDTFFSIRNPFTGMAGIFTRQNVRDATVALKTVSLLHLSTTNDGRLSTHAATCNKSSRIKSGLLGGRRLSGCRGKRVWLKTDGP